MEDTRKDEQIEIKAVADELMNVLKDLPPAKRDLARERALGFLAGVWLSDKVSRNR